MSSEIIVNADPYETRVALIENGAAAEVYIERESEKSIVGNIYKGRVTKVLPGMQAAFVDIGLDKAGFLYVNDVDTIESIENYQRLAAEEVAEEEDDLDFDGGEEEEDRNGLPRPRNDRRTRRWDKERHIEDLLKEGQQVIVQVSKEPLGTKGSRLTSYITLPGRYVVYMPTINQIGISRRIEDEDERRRLRKLVRKNRQPGAGYIVRTASENMPGEDIEANIQFLHALWDDILLRNERASAPSQVHHNLTLIQRTVRDLFNSSIDRMIIDDQEEFARCHAFLESYYPHLVPRLHHYTGDEPIFDHYGIELEIERALGQRVWLRSGGYIVIDQTEALTTIDVNTGRFVGKRNPEETIVQTNLEAVREIVAQLRLRNLGGIIIVDFIDMGTEEHRNAVLNEFRKSLARDRTRMSVNGFTQLGLVEMTRKRTRESLAQVLCEPCPMCEGRARLKTPQTVCYAILRELTREARQFNAREFRILASQPVIELFMDEESQSLAALSGFIGKPVSLQVETSYSQEQYDIILM